MSNDPNEKQDDVESLDVLTQELHELRKAHDHSEDARRAQADEIGHLRDQLREAKGENARLAKQVEAAETWMSQRQRDTVCTYSPGEEVTILPLRTTGRIEQVVLGRDKGVTYRVAYSTRRKDNAVEVGRWVLGFFQESDLEAVDLLPLRSKP